VQLTYFKFVWPVKRFCVQKEGFTSYGFVIWMLMKHQDYCLHGLYLLTSLSSCHDISEHAWTKGNENRRNHLKDLMRLVCKSNHIKRQDARKTNGSKLACRSQIRHWGMVKIIAKKCLCFTI
jgi:hypothetical protein